MCLRAHENVARVGTKALMEISAGKSKATLATPISARERTSHCCVAIMARSEE
jgi:hypothetical protein